MCRAATTIWSAERQRCTHKAHALWLQCQAGNTEYARQDAANIDWLRSGFAQAGQRACGRCGGVFQADPGFDLPETEDVDESTLPARYKGLSCPDAGTDRLTEQYAGQVLLVHGDTHFFKVDKPLYSPTRCCQSGPGWKRLAARSITGYG